MYGFELIMHESALHQHRLPRIAVQVLFPVLHCRRHLLWRWRQERCIVQGAAGRSYPVGRVPELPRRCIVAAHPFHQNSMHFTDQACAPWQRLRPCQAIVQCKNMVRHLKHVGLACRFARARLEIKKVIQAGSRPSMRELSTASSFSDGRTSKWGLGSTRPMPDSSPKARSASDGSRRFASPRRSGGGRGLGSKAVQPSAVRTAWSAVESLTSLMLNGLRLLASGRTRTALLRPTELCFNNGNACLRQQQ